MQETCEQFQKRLNSEMNNYNCSAVSDEIIQGGIEQKLNNANLLGQCNFEFCGVPFGTSSAEIPGLCSNLQILLIL